MEIWFPNLTMCITQLDKGTFLFQNKIYQFLEVLTAVRPLLSNPHMGSQDLRKNPKQLMSSTSLRIPQFIHQSRLVNNMSSINFSKIYHMSQPMLKSSVGGNSEQSQSRHVFVISGHSQQSELRPMNTTTLSINVLSSMSLLHSNTTNCLK
jgi:hypothetical protein